MDAAAKSPRRPSSTSSAVRSVCRFAFATDIFNAGMAVWFLSGNTPCRGDQWLSRFCHNLTGADKAAERALQVGVLLCSASQAADAVLAPRVPGRRGSRALSFVALAGSAANQLISAWLMGLVIATFPEDLWNMIISAVLLYLAMFSLFKNLALLLDEDEDDGARS